MADSTLSPSGPAWTSGAVSSYQAPAIALAKRCPDPSGRFSTSVRTTIRSRISPGIFDESKILVIPLPLRICETSGFQVTTTSWLVSLKNAPAISESEVFTYFTRFSSPARLLSAMARSNRYCETVFSTSSTRLPGIWASVRLWRTSTASLPLE